MLFHAISCYVMLFHVISCYFMLFHVISCYFMVFHAISCYFMLFHAISSYFRLFHAISCYFMLFHVMSCYFIYLDSRAMLLRLLRDWYEPWFFKGQFVRYIGSDQSVQWGDKSATSTFWKVRWCNIGTVECAHMAQWLHMDHVTYW